MNVPHPRDATRLLGHHALARRLEEAWQAKRLHHAILLQGPKGIGKATLGYMLAKLVLSGESSFAEAVRSTAHDQIAGGAAAGFRPVSKGFSREGRERKVITVDEIRAVEPFLRQRIGGGGWRVVLIDAATDMNVQAANALLKLLEEPGERTLYILIAQDARPLLPTIRSRCIHYRLAPLPYQVVEELLVGFGIDVDLAARSAKAARGSVARGVLLAERDALQALSALEELLNRPQWSAGAAQRVLDLAVAKDADDVFALVEEEVARHLRIEARETIVPHLADAAASIAAQLTEREAFGVDRRLNLRAALSEAHRARWNGGARTS